MTQRWIMQIAVAMACAVLLSGCSRKEEAAEESKPEAKPSAEKKDTLTLSEDARNGAHIEVSTVMRTNLNVMLRVPGRISLDLNHTAKVSSPFEGRIVK